MASAQGAPWWLVITLPLFSAVVAHYLTLRREYNKRDSDWGDSWSSAAAGLVKKISDDAIKHYVDSSSIPRTAISASLIISDLKRLSAKFREGCFKDAEIDKRAHDCVKLFRENITGSDDFQNEHRIARNNEDTLLDEIRDVEATLVELTHRARLRNHTGAKGGRKRGRRGMALT